MLCTKTEKWLYKLKEDYVWKSTHTQEKNWGFVDQKGVLQMKLMSDGHIVVMKGYCWDGCTPKFCLLDVLLGTPEGAVHYQSGHPKTWDASLVHDALCQFINTDLPLNQRQVDSIMLELLQEREFALSRFYWVGVRLFGWITKPTTNKIRGNKNGKRIELTGEQLVFEKNENNA